MCFLKMGVKIKCIVAVFLTVLLNTSSVYGESIHKEGIFRRQAQVQPQVHETVENAANPSLTDANAPKPATNATLTEEHAAKVNASSTPAPAKSGNSTQTAGQVLPDPVRTIDLSKPGVLNRAVIVFGGFGAVAILYFIFYRRRQLRKQEESPDSPANGVQFRYGVLRSDDSPDTMELSRVPLTSHSDDDSEEDLEIFRFNDAKQPYSSLPADNRSAVDDIMVSASDSWTDQQLLVNIDHTPVTERVRHDL